MSRRKRSRGGQKGNRNAAKEAPLVAITVYLKPEEKALADRAAKQVNMKNGSRWCRLAILTHLRTQQRMIESGK